MSEILDSNHHRCEVCQEIASHKCAACRTVFYCDKVHQRQHWKEHKKLCRPYALATDEVVGRHLVATRRIRAGDVVLQEAPVVWGPASNSIPVCLGCGKEINERDSRPCFKCGWPVCGDLCEKTPCHLAECRYTMQRGEKVAIKTFGIPHPIYRCIIILRCLYLRQFLPKSFKKLTSLESHDEERQLTNSYENERSTIAEFIRRFFKLSSTITESDIMKICGIIAINSHEVPLSEPPHIAVYANASFLEHNCSANCAKSFTSDGQIVITAAQDINAGDHLSICYADALWGTLNRRNFLKETKYFDCKCDRCRDVTEFGTNFSALSCQNSDCNGSLLPGSFIEDSNRLPDWSCDKCKRVISSYSAHDILERIGKDLYDLDRNDINASLNLLNTYQTYLSPNHFYIVDLKYNLAQIIGQNELSELTKDELSLKLKLCQELLPIIKVLAPAEKRTLGMILFELHASLAEITRRKALETTPEEMLFGLTESRKILVDALEALKHEPEVLPEGKVYQQAKENLKKLDVVLKTLQSNIKVDIM